MKPKITIWHTNDMHGRMSAETAERLRRLREGTPDSLLLDAGDAVAAGNVTWRLKEPIFELMRLAGYDAMALGNREFHLWQVGFAAKLRDSPHPVLCANLASQPRPLPGALRSSIVVELGSGLTVGILGLTVPMVTSAMVVSRLSHYVFEDPIAAGRREAAALRGRCNVLVALTHLGVKRDRELLVAAPEIDLIVGGHSHTPLYEPMQEAGRWIVQSEPFARTVGRVEVELGERGVVGVRGELIALKS